LEANERKRGKKSLLADMNYILFSFLINHLLLGKELVFNILELEGTLDI
jgi:hypothetical protein